MQNKVLPHSLFSDLDIYLFREGKHYVLYEKFGSHTITVDNQDGVYFAVWAPNAHRVSVIGNFNKWNQDSHLLYPRWDESGIWEGFIPDLVLGEVYKYAIETTHGEKLEKSDPFALHYEIPPHTASIVSTTWFDWKDDDWMETRHQRNSLNSPISVYEMHIGSWMRSPDDPEDFLGYRDIADKLIEHIKKTGFTHVEFMPVMEHPFGQSWGYQITGFFASSSRYGGPQDLMFLINKLHQNGIGVILDWVPSHFPNDAHGLYKFDGTHLYEHEDPRQGFHPDWKSSIFNYGRNEVRAFLISNAIFWLDRYHVDGLRVDAVTSMLHLDYSREEGDWIPNKYGGRENLEAISFLKEFNEVVYSHFPDIQTIAEESSNFPKVSRPTYEGGLGFGMKWMMGWMHDTLAYFKREPFFRKYHHNQLTFSSVYMYSENYMLPFSHDEVVHGKSPLIYKMPGDEWQKFANMRAMLLYMFTHPGAKLLFMGEEFGQTSEWSVDHSLDWHLLEYEPHHKLQDFVSDLNRMYRAEKALFENNFNHFGFEWIEANDEENSVYIYTRKGFEPENDLVIVLNLTPVVHENYRIGFPYEGKWDCIMNSDDEDYFGSGIKSSDIKTEEKHWMNRDYSAEVILPPLSGIVFKRRIIKKVKKK